MFIVISNELLNVLLKLYILLKSQKSIKKSDFEKHSDLILIHTTIIFYLKPHLLKNTSSHLLTKWGNCRLDKLRLFSLFNKSVTKHGLKSMLKGSSQSDQMQSFYF